MKVNDRVVHKDYPGTSGRVVAKKQGIILVLWDKKSAPWETGAGVRLHSRTSRHIPSALRIVQS